MINLKKIIAGLQLTTMRRSKHTNGLQGLSDQPQRVINILRACIVRFPMMNLQRKYTYLGLKGWKEI